MNILKLNIKLLKYCMYTLAFALSFNSHFYAQTILFDADFTTDNDGFADHSTANPPAMAPVSVNGGIAPNDWNLSYTSTPATDDTDNSFKVISGALVSQDWGGQGIFQSTVINVASVNLVDISAVSINAGANDDNFTYFYILDGGTRVNTAIGMTTSGDAVNYSLSNLDVSGSTSLVVGFEFSENGSSQGYSTSSFLVTTPAMTMCTPPEFTAVATCIDGGTDALFDTYYVSVEVTSTGSATTVDVDLPDDAAGNDDDQSGVGIGTYTFGPYNFIDGLAAQSVTVSDVGDASCFSSAEVSELRCGYTPDNGTVPDGALNACGTFCAAQGSATSSPTSPSLIAQAAPVASTQGMTNTTNYVYVLVAGGNVVELNNNGLFNTLMNGVAYTVYAYNVLETDRTAFESQFITGDAFAIPTSSECFSSCGNVTKTPDCFMCPTISALTATSPICSGTATSDLTATISGFFNTVNGDEDYDVEFVYSTTQETTAAGVYGLTATVIGTEDITAADVTSVTEETFTLPAVTTQTTFYVYARILNAATVVPDVNCRPFAETIIVVNPLPVPTSATLAVCDDDTDGFAEFTLTDANTTILNGQTGVTVSYHVSQMDAINNTMPLSASYTNTTANSQTIFARLETVAGCFATAEVSLTVNPLPMLTAQTPVLCDDNATFDLTSLEGDINAGSGTFAYSVGGTPVAMPTTFAATDGAVVDVTYTDGATSCFAATTITFTVNSNPTAGTATPLTICNADPMEFDVDLFANLTDEDMGGVWTQDAINPDALDIADPTSVDFQNAPAGTYSFTYSVTGTAPCGDDDETLVITVENCFDLALTKVLTSTGIFKPGDNVTFDIAVSNQGDVDAFDIDIEDYFVASELTFVSAIVSPNDTQGSTGSAITNGFTIDQLASMQTAIVQVTMTINPSFTGNMIINNAEITGAASVAGGPDAIDEDSTPGTDDGTVPDPNDNDTGLTDGSDDYDPATLIICQTNCGTFPWDGTN